MSRKLVALVMLVAIAGFFCLTTQATTLGYGYAFSQMGASDEELAAWGLLSAGVCTFASFATVGLASLRKGV